jgi:hypothetical protein
MYIDGSLVKTFTPTYSGTMLPLMIGSDNTFTSAFSNIIGTAKIHKGIQYAKFNVAKSYAKALKIIAKLGV